METADTTETTEPLPHTAEIETSTGTVSLVQITNIPGQGVTVHNAPTSVITAAQGAQGLKAFQVIEASDIDSARGEDNETKKRREILARRPSYRRILNELSGSDNQQTITVAKIEEESDSYSSDDDIATNLSTSSGAVPIQPAKFASPTSLKVIPAQTLQLAGGGDASAQGLQTLTMTNVSGSNGASPTGGATILQYAQSADGQFIIPVSALSSGNVQYQIAGTTASLPQGVVMASAVSGSSVSSHHVPEEASRKRELRLLKNREAARECRRKKKEYVKCLENRVAVLENQNKTLIEELKSLKELYCQKDVQS